MSDANSTPSATSGKPSKPYPDFPLFPHATKRWAKKIRGKLHYFGPWSDPDGALARYLEQKDALHGGRTPRPDTGETTVKDACNAFLNHRKALLDTGELSPRTWIEYRSTTDLLVERFGKNRLAADLRPDDFTGLRKHMAAKWGAHRLGKIIQYVRSVFKFAFDAELIDRPIRFGPGFKRPSRKVIRLNRAEAGPKLLSAVEVRQLIDAAGPAIKAMLLLAINCGFGNSDCGNLPSSAVDLAAAWIDYPRPKTGIPRRCPLWPETVQALRDALAKRPEPKNAEDAPLFFVTKYGLGWAKDTSTNPISQETAKLLKRIGVKGRKGVGFYTLRHVFRTVGDGAKDQPAVDHIMGHESPHMSSVYRETISDERLQAVAEYVRLWLFGDSQSKK